MSARLAARSTSPPRRGAAPPRRPSRAGCARSRSPSGARADPCRGARRARPVPKPPNGSRCTPSAQAARSPNTRSTSSRCTSSMRRDGGLVQEALPVELPVVGEQSVEARDPARAAVAVDRRHLGAAKRLAVHHPLVGDARRIVERVRCERSAVARERGRVGCAEREHVGAAGQLGGARARSGSRSRTARRPLRGRNARDCGRPCAARARRSGGRRNARTRRGRCRAGTGAAPPPARG